MTLDLPAALSQRVINALKADPRTVDLRAQAPHFYNLGTRILELFEEEEMVDVLIDVGCSKPNSASGTYLLTTSDRHLKKGLRKLRIMLVIQRGHWGKEQSF